MPWRVIRFHCFPSGSQQAQITSLWATVGCCPSQWKAQSNKQHATSPKPSITPLPQAQVAQCRSSSANVFATCSLISRCSQLPSIFLWNKKRGSRAREPQASLPIKTLHCFPSQHQKQYRWRKIMSYLYTFFSTIIWWFLLNLFLEKYWYLFCRNAFVCEKY